MSLHLIPTEVLRTSCRQTLEGCEHWLRRLIHDSFRAAFGPEYVQTAVLSGQAVFRKDLRERVARMRLLEPGRYLRPVDALLLDDLAAVLCKDDTFSAHFAPALEQGFPAGRVQLRSVLQRLVPIRNALSHANPITLHDAARVFCYCADIIEPLIDYYERKGMTNEFNAPSIVKVSDSIGHELRPASTQATGSFEEPPLRAGDSLRIEVEIDAHFASTDYTVTWFTLARGIDVQTGAALELGLEPKHVGEHLVIKVQVTSTKAWHRHRSYDAEVGLFYRVLPPLGDA